MRLKLSEPGYAVSGGLHVVALILVLVTLPHAEDFDPVQETVPIETVSASEFNEVMHGDKSAEKVVSDTSPAEQAAQTPAPPTPETQKPPPPPPPPPPPVAQQVPQPPSRPTPAPPVKSAPAPAQVPTPPTPPERVDADAEPLPAKTVPIPPRPPERVAEAKPQPPAKPRPLKASPKPDQLAKLLEEDPVDKPAEKPQPKAQKTPKVQAEAEPQEHSFDLTDISRLLSGTSAPPAKAAAGQGQTKVASLGSPTAHANKMAPSLWGQLDGLMEEQYRQCWSYLGLATGQKYIPQIKVTYDESGGLTSDPVLINPPSDPSLRSLAESAMRAVRRCNPLRIPTQYAPYYDEWKGRVLRFDPEQMAG